MPARPPVARQQRHATMLEVLGQFRVIFKSVRRHYQEVHKRTNVSGAQLWALSQIGKANGGTVGELARELAIHQSTASNLLNRLVKDGFVVRRRDGPDQRVVRLYITPRGRKVLARAPRPFIGVLQQGLADMPAASLAQLHRRLDLLIRAMDVRDQSSAKGLPLSEM